jgi:hypothetical protein
MKSILSLFLLTGILYSADLSRDSNGIVTDISTNLQWQDDIPSVEKTWSEAINYCEDLSLGGQDDWRLPNYNELISIVDYAKYKLAIKENVFQNITSSYYWSSSSSASPAFSSRYAWFVYFYDGSTGEISKTDSFSVCCVRGRE